MTPHIIIVTRPNSKKDGYTIIERERGRERGREREGEREREGRERERERERERFQNKRHAFIYNMS